MSELLDPEDDERDRWERKRREREESGETERRKFTDGIAPVSAQISDPISVPGYETV